MRCIFCKCDSTTSKSVEHIIPESLGNTTLILKPGIVCDKCNNYIAREVEKPFLEYSGIRHLRFEEGVLSKKGRISELQGIMSDDNGKTTVTVNRFPALPFPIYSGNPLMFTIREGITPSKTGKIYLPKFDSNYSLPDGSVLSRFLGKIALEFMALRLSEYPEGIEYLVDHIQLDELREHVRLGKTVNWPCSVRKIYEKETAIYNKVTNEYEQIINEVDILVTKNSEYYLVIAIWGIEFVINIGGAEIDGYYAWLKENENQSPLYIDKDKWLKSLGLQED